MDLLDGSNRQSSLNFNKKLFVSILNSDFATFTKLFFQQDEYLIDFSKPFVVDKDNLDEKMNQQKLTHFWGTQPRIDHLSVDVNTFESGMDSRRYTNFVNMISFIINIFVKNSKEKSTEDQTDQIHKDLDRQKVNEMKDRGRDALIKHLDQMSRTKESEFSIFYSKSSTFECLLKRVNLKLLKDGEPHYVLSMKDFCKRDIYESNGRVDQTYSLGKLNVTNLMSKDPLAKELLRGLTLSSSNLTQKTTITR